MIYLIGRSIFPSSELKTQDWLRKNSALVELYGISAEKLTRHHLYKVSRMLYSKKEKIEKFLSKRTDYLFVSQDKIVLYDLTNTYFEGRKRSSKKARFGISKEKRKDAKLMALAMVTDSSGFIKYSKCYEGNIKDSKTLQATLMDLESYPNNTSLRNKCYYKKVVVMDAGIATEDNLILLRKRHYDYVCVSLSKMNDIVIG
jgi:transposase